jgi:hypothetical protein
VNFEGCAENVARQCRLFSALQYRQLIVEPCAHIADLVFDVGDLLWPQSQSCNDLLGHMT